MRGQKGTNDCNTQRVGESRPATRCSRLPRTSAYRGQYGVAHPYRTSGGRLRRYVAILTLVLTSAAVSAFSGAAVAGHDAPDVSRPPEGMPDHVNGAVRPPIAPAASPGVAPKPTPRTSGPMLPATRVRLIASFRLATRLVRESPTCEALFQRLRSNGEETLARTVFERAGLGKIEVCHRRHATAFTRLGTSTTWICPAFDQLVSTDAALTLIHEALHFAGLPELPGTPEALDSSQIQAMVAANCGPARLRQPRDAATLHHPVVVTPPNVQTLPRSFDSPRSP